MYTQVEITREGECKVVWLPVSEGTVHVGDKIYAKEYTHNYREWVITQVCITLDFNDIPVAGNVAGDFRLTPPRPNTIHIYI